MQPNDIPLEYVIDPDSGCWNWTLTKLRKSDGYARIRVNGRQELAHRIVYMRHRGEIPDGLELDHLCRNRGCVNPEHLDPVAHRVNVLRGAAPMARYAAQTECLRGHPFDDDNTYWYTVSGRAYPERRCRACHREKMKHWQRAKHRSA